MPTLDRTGLEDEFEIGEPVLEPEIVDDEFEKEWEDEQDPNRIIRDNIEKANEILDQVTDELTNGNFSARLVEVAGQLINSITAAGKELIGDRNYQAYLLLKNRMLELEKEKLEVRKLGNKRPTNQNLIIANREDVLKLLNKDSSDGQESESSS